ncbi:DUF4352 domain-containing protein [Nocardiopsis terrae]
MLAGCITFVAVLSSTGTNTPSTDDPAPRENPGTQTTTATGTSEVDIPGVGDEVTAGDFAYTVTDHTTATEVTGSFDTFIADGRYVIVHITATNNGTEPDYFENHGITLYDTGGRQFDHDSDATIALDEGPSLGKMNPGETGEFTVAFDLPDDSDPERITVTNDLWSDEPEPAPIALN